MTIDYYLPSPPYSSFVLHHLIIIIAGRLLPPALFATGPFLTFDP